MLFSEHNIVWFEFVEWLFWHAKLVLLLQKKVIWSIAGKGFKDSCRPLFISLSIVIAVNLYILIVLTNAIKMHGLSVLRNDIHGYDIRFKSKLDTPFKRFRIKKMYAHKRYLCKTNLLYYAV